MERKKKSIRDFFTPTPRSSPAPARQKLPTPDVKSSDEPLPRTDLHSSQPANSVTTAEECAFPASASGPSSFTPKSADAPAGETLPPSISQNSFASSTGKRTVSNGEEVVQNSDSDTDSLDDLDWGANVTTVKPTAHVSLPKRSLRVQDDELRKPAKRERTSDQSFNRFIKVAKQSIETEQSIAEHKAALEQADDLPTLQQVELNKTTFDRIVHDDEDSEKAGRLLLAIQRTEAVQTSEHFRFFEDDSKAVAARARFPASALRRHRWAKMLQDSTSRDQAFMSGYVKQVLRYQELPLELASWMLDEICLGDQEALISKYLDILESHNDHIQKLLDRNKLHAVFDQVGAKTDILTTSAEVALSSEKPSADPVTVPASLPAIIKLLKIAAPGMYTKTRIYAIHALCFIAIDSVISTHISILNAIQDAIEALFCHFSTPVKLTHGVGSTPPQPEPASLITSQLSTLLDLLLPRITHPLLQTSLISALPATSPLTASFRRHLALAFLFYPEPLTLPLSDPKIPSLIHAHLDASPAFRIGKDTNYTHLAARLTLLDIAIGPGLLTPPYHTPLPPSSTNTPLLPPTTPTPAFNATTSALAQHIKLLGNSIVEAGAVVDLSILDAKDCVERLCARLECAVRVGGRKVRDVFGEDGEDVAGRDGVKEMFARIAKRKAGVADGKTEEVE